jgi:ubiquinone/menaquinone biosynthesis C-methylase UbiE
MTNKVAERLLWAVETLAVAPNDQLLEIGCGHGVAVSLVCEHLAGGKITAIDRSEAMIKMASRRNHAHIAAGKAEFQTVDLADAAFGDKPFNKIFAFHVNLFWRQPARELAILRRVLAAGGALYFFYQPLQASKIQEQSERLSTILHKNGLSITEVLVKELKPTPAVCTIAEPS